MKSRNIWVLGHTIRRLCGSAGDLYTSPHWCLWIFWSFSSLHQLEKETYAHPDIIQFQHRLALETSDFAMSIVQLRSCFQALSLLVKQLNQIKKNVSLISSMRDQTLESTSRKQISRKQSNISFLQLQEKTDYFEEEESKSRSRKPST